MATLIRCTTECHRVTDLTTAEQLRTAAREHRAAAEREPDLAEEHVARARVLEIEAHLDVVRRSEERAARRVSRVWPRLPLGFCWVNASAMAALYPDELEYVEGTLVAMLGDRVVDRFAHAWNVDRDGRVVDAAAWAYLTAVRYEEGQPPWRHRQNEPVWVWRNWIAMNAKPRSGVVAS